MLNSVLMGGVELFRYSELDPEKRIYPGGFFDPLNLADPANPERAFQLKTAEIKHARLAMVAALGEWHLNMCACAWRSVRRRGCFAPAVDLQHWHAHAIPSGSRPCSANFPAPHATGFGIQAAAKGTGALGSLEAFGSSF